MNTALIVFFAVTGYVAIVLGFARLAKGFSTESV